VVLAHQSLLSGDKEIDVLERLDNGKERKDEESQCTPVNKLISLLKTISVRNDVQMAKRAQVMAAAPAASPSLLAKAYAAAVDSRKTKARNTKILVQTPALWVCELTPNASNRERTTRTMVPFCQLRLRQ
jgi:hypothetical protein